MENRQAKGDFETGIAAALAGDPRQSSALLRRFSKVNPSSELVWLWRAKVAADMEEFEMCLSRALKINPKNARTRVWLQEIREQATVSRRVTLKSEKWHCPLCSQSFTVKPLRCAQCRAVLSLADLSEFFDERPDIRCDLVTAAVDRLMSSETASSTGDLAARYRVLGLAFLNLGRFVEAEDHLMMASEMMPNDADLRSAVDTLRERCQMETDLDLPDPRDRSTRAFDSRRASEMALAALAERDPAKREGRTEGPEFATTAIQLQEGKVVLAEDDIEQRADRASAIPEVESAASILVVDDSPTIRKVLSSVLERHGFEVLQASSGMESLARLRGALPDLIILDVSMPHLDGYEVCKIIKGNELTSHIPVIFLTGKTGFLDRVRGRVAGGVEYIAKPVQPEVLLQLIDRHLLMTD